MSEREELEAEIAAIEQAWLFSEDAGDTAGRRRHLATALLSSGYAKGNGELVRGVAVPAGYVLVPSAPTEEMAKAGDVAILTADLSVVPLPSWQTARVCYAAMLSAATPLPNDEPNVDVNRLIEIERAGRDVLCEWDDVNIGGVEMDVADHTKRIERLREALAAPDGREHIEVTAPYRRSNTGEE